MSKLQLYSRPDCHLCEEAEAMLTLLAPGISVETLDIEDDIRLLDRYGVRVPVLRREPDGAELGWPFDAQQLGEFIKGP